MKYWPEISFRFTDCDSSLKAKEKVNLFPEQTESGGAENFARCTRVLRKLDSCPGEKSLTSMSTVQNTTAVSRHCNTREPSWAEDLIDLSEFCQPSTVLPMKMEDSVDESSASPITSNTVNAHHGFDYAIEVNDFDGNIDDTIWRMPSPAIAMHEELGDPLSDWLSPTKETNNNHHNLNHNHHHSQHHGSGHVNVNNLDNLTTRAEISYNISDALLTSNLMSVPNSAQPTNYVANRVITAPSHQLQSNSLYYPNESPFDSIRNHPNSATTGDPMLSRPPTSTGLSPVNTMYIGTRRMAQTIPTPSTYTIPSHHSQFLSMESLQSVPPLANVPSGSVVDVQTTHAVLGPSVAQSNPIPAGEEPISRGVTIHRGGKRKLNAVNQSVTLPAVEMLPPLVSKNLDFDLVSYVFDEHTKPPAPLDVPSLSQPNTSKASVRAIQTECGASRIEHTGDSGQRPPSASSVTIKTEPQDEATEEGHRGHLYGRKRHGSKDEEDSPKARRMRRSSNCSIMSDDITQLESEKYRELRNKNNAASRRSRANRKNREVLQRESAVTLEADNKRLKVKAEEMEKLVNRLRHCLLQIVAKRR